MTSSCQRGECDCGTPLLPNEGVRCIHQGCQALVHPICSIVLAVNGNGTSHDGVLICRSNLYHFLEEDSNDWIFCLKCASDIAAGIQLDNNDRRDRDVNAFNEGGDNDRCGSFDDNDKAIAAAIHDDVAEADAVAAAVNNANNSGTTDSVDDDVAVADAATAPIGNIDDANSGDDGGTVLTDIAVVTEDDEEGGDGEGGGGEIISEEEEDELTLEDVKQKLSEFLQKVRPYVTKKGYYKNHPRSARYAHMLLRIKKLLDSETVVTKHSFWYTVKAFFLDRGTFESTLNDLANEIGVLSIVQLNIVPDPQRGSMVASFEFMLSIDGSSPQRYTQVGGTYCHQIPNALLAAYGLLQDVPDDIDPEAEREKSTIKVVGPFKPKFIITLEKLAWLKTLVEQGILKDEDIIIICTQGYPTRHQLAFVHFLHQSYPDVPIVHGGDVGPIAVDIMLRFDRLKSTGMKFHVPIKWGFVRPSDVYGNAVVENALHGSMSNLSQRDAQADARVREREWMQASEERMNELDLIRDNGKKYDMNDFELGIKPKSLKDFVLERLRFEDWV